MPLMLFTATFDQTNPRVLSADARAVPAEPYTRVEDDAGNPGGITRGDVADADIRLLGDLADGAEVYVEGDADDVLDDTDDATAADTRIWWRARVVER